MPSLDARLVPRLGLRPDVKRVPMFGLGCVGRRRRHRPDARLPASAWPDHVAVLLAVELCSLTVQRPTRRANMVASGLFGDGAAAVVVRGASRAPTPGTAPRACRRSWTPAAGSTRTPQTYHGLATSAATASASCSTPERRRRRRAATSAATSTRSWPTTGCTVADIGAWVCHPGGPKVIDAVRDALELPDDAGRHRARSLAEVGNLSSASVLHVLADT